MRGNGIDESEERRAVQMPPRGVKKGSKRARQYAHIKKSEKEAGRSEPCRGDRRAGRQQGKGALGRIENVLAQLDPRSLGEQPRRQALQPLARLIAPPVEANLLSS
jgi:hypothetical protein